MDFTLIVSFVSIAILAINNKIKLKKEIGVIACLLFLIWIYTIVSSFLQVEDDIYYLQKYTRCIVSFFATYIITQSLVKRYAHKDIELTIGYVLALNLTIMWLQVFSPELKASMQAILFEAGRNNWYRVTGLLNGTSSAGIFLGLSSIYFIYLYDNHKNKFFLLSYLFSIPMFPLSGMTGLIISTAGIAIIAGKRLLGLCFIVKTLTILSFVLVLFIVLFNTSSELLDKYGITLAQKRVMVLFDDDVDIQHGNPEKSVSALLRSYSLPKKENDILFGNLQPSKSDHATTSSDAGLITNIHAYGVVGLSLLIFTLSAHALMSRKKIIVALTIAYLIAFTKNDLLFGRIIYDLYILIFFVSVLSSPTKKAVTIQSPNPGRGSDHREP